jgi:hypothetical protein
MEIAAFLHSLNANNRALSDVSFHHFFSSLFKKLIKVKLVLAPATLSESETSEVGHIPVHRATLQQRMNSDLEGDGALDASGRRLARPESVSRVANKIRLGHCG